MSLVSKLIEQGYLLDSKLAPLLDQLQLPLEHLLKLNPPRIITKSFFLTNLKKFEALLPEAQAKQLSELFPELKPKAEAAEAESSEVQILSPLQIKAKKIEVTDFIQYFNARFNLLKPFVQERLEGVTSIDKLPLQKRKVSVIGLLVEKRITRNKNLLLSIEDPTGIVRAIIGHANELFQQALQLVEDEVIGISGIGNKEIIFVDQIVWPELALKEPKRAPFEVYAAFTSDLHIGSDKFLEQNFLAFLDWLQGKSGNATQQELVSKLKWLFLVGDLVDGIGVYPLQEEELTIQDIRLQYRLLAKFLAKIPKTINIIACPGGLHDAVHPLEPQPPIPKSIAPELYELPNLYLVTNPARIRITCQGFEGLEVLLYHGDSYDYYADSIDWLRLNNAKQKPELIQHFLLKRRHLAPTHQSTHYIPLQEDPLLIKKAPDIFVSGHIHKSGISNYNNILTISCSCWQAKTPYQEKFGHEPDPCKVPLLNLKTGKIKVLDFS